MQTRVIVCTAALSFSLAAVAVAERLKVQINDAPVREKKSTFSKVVGKLNLGDEIEATEEKDEKTKTAWYLVKQGPAGPLNGYLSAKAVVPADKAKATGKALSKGADDPELQAATRGWDDAHKSSTGGGRDYESVNWMEKVSRMGPDGHSAARSVEFRNKGKIGEYGPRGGGQ